MMMPFMEPSEWTRWFLQTRWSVYIFHMKIVQYGDSDQWNEWPVSEFCIDLSNHCTVIIIFTPSWNSHNWTNRKLKWNAYFMFLCSIYIWIYILTCSKLNDIHTPYVVWLVEWFNKFNTFYRRWFIWWIFVLNSSRFPPMKSEWYSLWW